MSPVRSAVLPLFLLAGACSDPPGLSDGGTRDAGRDLVISSDAPRDLRADRGLNPSDSALPAPGYELWFTPNVESPDMLDLFTKPGSWTYARGKLRILKFYAAQVDAKPCPSCGPNVASAFAKVNAFTKLASWGVEIGLEVGVIKEWGCTAVIHSKITLDAMASVAAQGGKVRHLAMDEPYIGGQYKVNGKTCGYTLQQCAQQTVSYIKQVKAVHPSVRIGDIEPYPHFSASQLTGWVKEVEKQGGKLDFFHLDVDRKSPGYNKAKAAADLKALQSFCAARKIPFGVIFWGQEANSNAAYFNNALSWVKDVAAAIGRPGHAIFQSWVTGTSGKRTVPINLPEGDPQVFSHTRLLNAGWAALVDNNALFISQSVPASMKAGQKVTVKLTVKNMGPLRWTEIEGYRLGTPNYTWSVGRATLGPKEIVLPGAQKTFAFTVTAPKQPGSYAFQWQMVQEHVGWFGGKSKLVQVSVTP